MHFKWFAVVSCSGNFLTNQFVKFSLSFFIVTDLLFVEWRPHINFCWAIEFLATFEVLNQNQYAV